MTVRLFFCVCFALLLVARSESTGGASIDLTVIAGADGSIRAVFTATGETAWTFATHRSFLSSFSRADGLRLLPTPYGAVYLGYGSGADEVLQLLSPSIGALVSQSPFISRDGSFFTGSRRTTVYALNAVTGEVLYHVSSPDPGSESRAANGTVSDGSVAEGECPSTLPAETLFVSRADYVLSMLEPRSAGGGEACNVSFSELTLFATDYAASADSVFTCSPHGLMSHYAMGDDSPVWRHDARQPVVATAQFSVRYNDDNEDAEIEVLLRPPGLFGYVPSAEADLGTDTLEPVKSAYVSVSSKDGPILLGGGWKNPVRAGIRMNDNGGAAAEVVGGLVSSRQARLMFTSLAGGRREAETMLGSMLVPVDWGWSSMPQKVYRGEMVDRREGLFLMGTRDAFKDDTRYSPTVSLNTDVGREPLPPGLYLQGVPVPPPTEEHASTWDRVVKGVIVFVGFLNTVVVVPTGIVYLILYRRRRAAEAASAEQHVKRKRPRKRSKVKQKAADDLEPNTMVKLGQMTVSRTVLGYGSGGTMVYDGMLSGRRVAVKRLLSAYVEIAANEVETLIRSDAHPSILRYFAKETDPQFIYLALELCPLSLADLYGGPDANSLPLLTGAQPHEAKPQLGTEAVAERRAAASAALPAIKDNKKRLIRDALSGVAYLHRLGVVHRDIKPQNILISNDFRAKVADMGFSKRLPTGASSFSWGAAGAVGWQAPEVLEGGRITRAVDSFALGCLAFYIITEGKHPFGPRFTREAAIVGGKPSAMSKLGDDALAIDFIGALIAHDPHSRTQPGDAALHPFLWSDAKRLTFMHEASDRLECLPLTDPIVVEFERCVSPKVVGRDGWRSNLDDAFVEHLGPFRKYNYSSARDLLRVIRNKKHHYHDLPVDIQGLLGSMPSGYVRYFAKRFPRLLVLLWAFLGSQADVCAEETFRKYFKSENSDYWEGADDVPVS